MFKVKFSFFSDSFCWQQIFFRILGVSDFSKRAFLLPPSKMKDKVDIFLWICTFLFSIPIFHTNSENDPKFPIGLSTVKVCKVPFISAQFKSLQFGFWIFTSQYFWNWQLKSLLKFFYWKGILSRSNVNARPCETKPFFTSLKEFLYFW